MDGADKRRAIRWLLLAAVLVLLATVYKRADPAAHILFPKCPVKMLTGWDCPGCGSQRAIHALLNGDVAEALRMNALMVLSIPYVLAGFALDRIRRPGETALKWRRRLFGRQAILIVLAVIVLYTVGRNIMPPAAP